MGQHAVQSFRAGGAAAKRQTRCAYKPTTQHAVQSFRAGDAAAKRQTRCALCLG